MGLALVINMNQVKSRLSMLIIVSIDFLRLFPTEWQSRACCTLGFCHSQLGLRAGAKQCGTMHALQVTHPFA